MIFSDILRTALIGNNRKITPEEQIMLNKIPNPGTYQPTISAIVSDEQQVMPVRLTPEQIKANVNLHLYGRINK